jgi:ABC-2 type transport system permease protein
VRLQILTIARNTFVESIRQPIVFVLVVLCGVLILFTTWSAAYSMGYTDSSEVTGDDKMLLEMGLATVLVFGMLLAAFIATAAVSREIENKTVLTVVSKPVPRPSLIVGKYLGVAGAILLALVPMLLFLLMGLRHGVLSTAADDPDQPVILFTLLAVGLSLLVAVWCNYFYGSYFSQTFLLLLTPAMLAAYLLVLMIGKKWQVQPIGTNFKPQITFACGALVIAVLVLTSVATAVSTRLGQVMTVVVCAGVFLFGLLSNYLIGRHAFHNRPVGMIQTVVARDSSEPMLGPGGGFKVTFRNPPTPAVRVGDSFYYGPTPSGFPMSVSAFPRFRGDVSKPEDVLAPATPAGLVVAASQGRDLEVRRVGTGDLPAGREPIRGDSVFLEPTRVNAPALAVWGVIPNMHYFWLVDAVTQNQRVPVSHMGLVGAYGAAQIAAFLCLGVVLFQKRDVG